MSAHVDCTYVTAAWAFCVVKRFKAIVYAYGLLVPMILVSTPIVVLVLIVVATIMWPGEVVKVARQIRKNRYCKSATGVRSWGAATREFFKDL